MNHTAECPRRIALLTHCGNGNLGDEATLATIIANIRRRDPTAVICALTANPEDTIRRHRIEALPLRRQRTRLQHGTAGPGRRTGGAGVRATLVAALKRIPFVHRSLKAIQSVLPFPVWLLRELVFVVDSARRLRGLSILVVAGGGQLGDYFGGIWGYPYYIVRWAILARAMGAKVVFLSVGAGPIVSRVSALFFRTALSLASYRSFRDYASRQLVEGVCRSDDNHVVSDVVIALNGFSSPPAFRGTGSSLTIAINPVPYFDSRYWAEHDPDAYSRHVRAIGAFAAWLLEAGHRVVFFPTQLNADPPVIEDVGRILPSLSPDQQARLLDRSVQDFESLLAVISSADAVVTGRYHGQILAMVLRRAVIGLAYDPKTNELFREMGLEPFALHIGSADLAVLQRTFRRLVDQLDDVHAAIDHRLGEHRRRVEAQYDLLFGEAGQRLKAPLVS